ncbi:MAG: MFS transporter [Acidiferrobacterales bacterium]
MADRSQYLLLRQRRFAPFFVTQFLGAFNDNVFKNALVILIAFHGAGSISASTNTVINLSAGLFILPFFLFSATAGQIADRFEKSLLMRLIKLFEILIMIGVAFGFYFNDIPLLIGLLFLMGAHSTLFGPVKYSIMPEQLASDELIGGNGLVEMGTFLAILIGTICGGVLIDLPGEGATPVSIMVLVAAVGGYLASRAIPATPASAPQLKINWNPLSETWRNLQFLRGNRTVYLAVLGISWFWFYGAIYLAQLPNYTRTTLGGGEHVVTLLLTMFSLGIGIGSLLCERLSGHKTELGLVPFGSIGLTLFGIDLYFARPVSPPGALLDVSAFLHVAGHWRVLADFVLIGVFGGFYIVPLYALIQQRSEPSHRSRIIAGNNILNALLMVISAILAIVLLKAGASIAQLLLLTALLNAVVAFYIFTLVPEFLMRFLVWMLIHTIYRVRTQGLEQIPDEGPVLLVCNHVSYVDALVIGGCIRRPVRFVMDQGIYRTPILNFIFRTARAIPIAPAREDPEILERAYAEIDAALKAQDVVCVFPEGRLTSDGEMNPFRPGIEHIVARNAVPVIPLALRGLWGSIFSRKENRVLNIAASGLSSRIGLVAGASVSPGEASAAVLQERVLALRGNWR